MSRELPAASGSGEARAVVLVPVRPAGASVPVRWHFPAGLEDFPGAGAFRFWQRRPSCPAGVLHPEGHPEEGLLLGEAHALGCTVPLSLTGAEHTALGELPAQGLAFFLCLGALPERPGETVLAVRGVLAVALGSGVAVRLCLPQPCLPAELPMARLAGTEPV